MSYIELKKVNDTEYISFVKKFTFMGKNFRIKEHIGRNISTITIKDFLRKNFTDISRKEFEIRKMFLDRLDIVYNINLLDYVELKSIEINNLFEMKDIKDVVLVEFAKEFIFNSNNIEGSKIPAKEVKKIIETGSSRYSNRNEIKEVYNSIEAMNYLRSGFKFNLPSIKRLYYILTKGLTMSGGDPYPRGFKTVENIVNNQSTVSPDRVENELSNLLKYYIKNKKIMYPFKLAFDFHLKYENIHPFLDANGRTGRLIMNKILMDHGYFPIIIYANNSRAYHNAIAKGLQRRTKKNYYQLMFEQAKKTYEVYFTITKQY
ncbi:MAG: Fic family protein [Candidatus Thermoplasmatota archaeon]|nr:Fic family protein [Candidatus Thermoplasmatota archaeon]